MSNFVRIQNTEMGKSEKKLSGFALILINLAVMALAVLLIILILFRWMNSYTRHDQYIKVPDVQGLLEDQAAGTLSGNSLRYEISDYKYDAHLAEGQIMEQRPKAGANVKAGRIIHLTVNSGKIPMKKIPDVADNSSLRAAESRLLGAGFKLTEPEYIPGDADWVYEVRLGDRVLRNGEEVPEGSTLTIVAGNGDEVIESPDSLADIEIDQEFFL